MGRKVKITFAESAVKDLEGILAWYADQHVPVTGEKFIREIMAQVERLTDFPMNISEFGRRSMAGSIDVFIWAVNLYMTCEDALDLDFGASTVPSSP
jgi:plasmid stabilization system protein ParE